MTFSILIFSIHHDFAYRPFRVNLQLHWAITDCSIALTWGKIGGFSSRVPRRSFSSIPAESPESSGKFDHAPSDLLALFGCRLRGFSVVYNGFFGLPKPFGYIRGTNSESEVRSLLLTPTLPASVFKKRFLAADASLDDFRQDSFVLEKVLRRSVFQNRVRLWSLSYNTLKRPIEHGFPCSSGFSVKENMQPRHGRLSWLRVLRIANGPKFVLFDVTVCTVV